MADKDTLGDLAQHAVDAVTGLFKRTASSKPGYSVEDASHHLGAGLADKGAQTVSGRKKQIDDAVDDAS